MVVLSKVEKHAYGIIAALKMTGSMCFFVNFYSDLLKSLFSLIREARFI